MTTGEGGEYISIADAADQYGTTRTYFYDRIKAGEIAGYEIPGKRGTFMKRREVEAFMQPKPKTFGKDGQTA